MGGYSDMDWSAAQDPCQCSGVIFQKKKKVPIFTLAILPQNAPNFPGFAIPTPRNYLKKIKIKIRPIVGDFFIKNGVHDWGFLAKTKTKKQKTKKQTKSSLYALTCENPPLTIFEKMFL